GRSSATIQRSPPSSARSEVRAIGLLEAAMIKGAWFLQVRQSVFTKLVATMLSMAVVLLALVAAFFVLYLGPVMNASIAGVVHEYMHTVAASKPSYPQAQDISRRLDVQTRYEGPDGAWTTAGNLPSAAEARRHGHGAITGHRYYVMPAADGG